MTKSGASPMQLSMRNTKSFTGKDQSIVLGAMGEQLVDSSGRFEASFRADSLVRPKLDEPKVGKSLVKSIKFISGKKVTIEELVDDDQVRKLEDITDVIEDWSAPMDVRVREAEKRVKQLEILKAQHEEQRDARLKSRWDANKGIRPERHEAMIVALEKFTIENDTQETRVLREEELIAQVNKQIEDAFD